MSREVLIVVDMQSTFLAAQDRELVARVEWAMDDVVRRGGHVLAVMYDACGAATVKLPPGTPIIWKNVDSGAEMVYAWMMGMGLLIPDVRIRVAGVNLSACVWKTADGLAWRLSEEKAICDAVTIETGLCGNKASYRIAFAPPAA